MSHFVNFTLLPPLCYSLKITNCRMREKEIFCMYDCFSISRCIKGGRKSHYEHNRGFRRTYMCKHPILTKLWNYNIFVQILHNYLRYTDRFLGMFFLLLAVILSEFYEKPRRKDWVTEKSIWKNLCERHPSYVIFVAFFIYSFLPPFFLLRQ